MYENKSNKNIKSRQNTRQKQNLTLNEKKKLIAHLKKCAQYYKDNLLGNYFLIVFNNGNYIELLFKKSNFKHLTGISSQLSADRFYKKCIGKNREFINPNEIYTTIKHPKHLALKKLHVFMHIYEIFCNQAFVLEEVTTETKLYKFALADICLTLLCENHNTELNYLTAISLRSNSYLKKAKDYHNVDYVLIMSM